ncbi:hypothetical protein EJ04DRAFT_509643 [Polyplosphaeria fusca]|uniref:Uncharacterized protein n=1 Tax=Polyplosphaeria fusca TaxID=682080 RepID=A0A9P4R5I7_9PLEO|nr:hypothetical protein EJ04DRAFT_509643 [Polyplosphaeria fusca]
MASWNFTVQKINESFDQLARWYRDFMHRTEISFRALHERIAFLEERQASQRPTDEQLERVLRRILAEKFAGRETQRTEDLNATTPAYFVEKPGDDMVVPEAIPIEIASIQVDPEAIPSRTYSETLRMLENKLPSFPSINLEKTMATDSSRDSETPPPTHRRHDRPW